MKSFGLALLITGIFLISLSGLEKIIIYASLHDRVGDYQFLKVLTPNEIWNITQRTFIFGIVLSIIGLLISMWILIDNQLRLISKANKRFEIEHRDNKQQ